MRSLGLTDDAIDRRARAGRLHRLHRGVYAVGHPGLTREGRYLAAALACGDGAAVSHRCAGVLLGLPVKPGPEVEVTVPRPGGARKHRGIAVHRSPLSSHERGFADGIPVTSPARTIADLADRLSRRQLERVVDESLYLGYDLARLEPIPGRRGSGLLAAVRDEHMGGTTRTRSELEELFLALVRRERLPAPEVNTRIEDFEVDFCWPQARLIVETDGAAAHRTPRAFETDRVRDARLLVAGWRVVRVTSRRLVREPQSVAAQLRTLLAGA